jgi:hypothetical protein
MGPEGSGPASLLRPGASLALALFLSGTAASAGPRPAPGPGDFVPATRLAHFREGRTFALAGNVVIDSDQPREDAYALRILRGLCAEARPAAADGHPRARPGRITLRAGRPTSIPEGTVAAQSYTLGIAPDRIVITGPTAAARLHGVQTLRQLARVHGSIPAGTIADGPALAVRGFSLDISRGRMPRPDDLVVLLDLCASFKLNHLLLYIEDTFEYTNVPKDARRPYGLTRRGLRELTEQAALRSITLVPIVETLAHQERMLAHPQMWKHAEAPGWSGRWARALLAARATLEQLLPGRLAAGRVRGSQFAVTEPRTQALVGSMVDDVLAASRAPDVHIGCDEPGELGTGASRAVARRHGTSRIYVDHVRRLATHAREKWNARTWIYDDFVLEHPSILDSLPADVILVDWRKYDPAADYSDLEALAPRVRSRVVTSPGLWNWSAIVPAYRRAVVNIARSTQVAKRNGCLGSVLAAWGDGGAEDLLGNDIAGIAYFADCSWALAERTRQAFAGPYARIRFGASAVRAEVAIAALLDLEIPHLVYSQRLVYRPVLVRRRAPRWLSGLEELGRTVDVVRNHLVDVSPADHYAAAEIQAVQGSMDRLGAAIRRERTLDSLASGLASSGGDPAIALAGLAQAEERVQRAYERAWRDHNEISELESVLRRFRSQVRSLDSLRWCAVQGTLRLHGRGAGAGTEASATAHGRRAGAR